MSQRRALDCPNCGSACGTLLADNSIRCDWKMVSDNSHPNGWRTVVTGKTKRGTLAYEYTPNSAPGCGGLQRPCVHGLRVCVGWPPCITFTNATEPPAVMMSLAETMRRDIEESNHRREIAKHTVAVTFAPKVASPAAQTRVQLPFLGEAESTHYTPPIGRKKKAP